MYSFKKICTLTSNLVLAIILLCCCAPKCFSADDNLESNQISKEETAAQRPHIIFIVADDAGWNDFSFHGSPQIPTPNIDAVALNGIILNSYYSAPLCTPSRGSTLTGKYALHLGLQHYVITGGQQRGLPLEEKLLPQYLKELGYGTHLVGKWHLGHARKTYTPTYRGFDSHYGYYLGKQDYYSHMSREQYGVGYDFRSNLTVNYDPFGKYNTDLFTDEAIRLIEANPEDQPLFLMIAHVAPHSSYPYDPLQAPQENVDKFENSIHDVNRRRYAGMVDKLDESVGRVVSALEKQNMLQNSIIIFVSDNGGAPGGYDLNYGSNWPLRGTKSTLWEGGTRLAACIWSPLLQPSVHEHQMHASDWLPTLLEAAQGNLDPLPEIDGVSQWKSLRGQGSPPRTEFLYNIDGHYNNSAVRYGKWKLIKGNTTSADLGGCPIGLNGEKSCGDWFGPSGREPSVENEVDETCPSQCSIYGQKNVSDLLPLIVGSEAGQAFDRAGYPINQQTALSMQVKANLEEKCDKKIGEIIPCDAFNYPCLYNIEEDPCERRNLAENEPELVDFLSRLIQDYNETAIEPLRRWNDPDSAPAKWGYIWTFFMDLVDP